MWRKTTRDGSVETPLTNFSARIVADLLEDDGVEARRVFEVEATLEGRTQRFRVPAERFAGMNWPTEHLGAAAIVWPGFGLRDHGRAAVQTLSGEIATRHVFAHAGWRTINSAPCYLACGRGDQRDRICGRRRGDPATRLGWLPAARPTGW